MDGSIGSVLSSIGGLSSPGRSSSAPQMRHADRAPDTSFTELLQQSMHAHAAQRGYELPIPPGGHETGALPNIETADEIWDRAVARDQAGPGGIADALMKSLSESADRRWEQRRDREHGGSSTSSLFDF